MLKRTWLIILLLLSFLSAPRLSIGQDIFVGPDGKFEEQTLSVPYAPTARSAIPKSSQLFWEPSWRDPKGQSWGF
jgi:hypothetical protein